MSSVSAQSGADIAATIDVVFGHAADFSAMSAWQPDLQVVEVLARDAAGRALRVYTELDTPLRRAKTTLDVRYQVPSRIDWTMVEGNVPTFAGSWTLTRVSDAITRVEYEVIIDFGRLGRLVRGPAAGLLRDQTVSSMPHRLKTHIETLEPDGASVAMVLRAGKPLRG